MQRQFPCRTSKYNSRNVTICPHCLMKKSMGGIYRKDISIPAATDKFIEELILGFKDFHF